QPLITTGDGPVGIALGDVNGDGDLDIAYAIGEDTSVGVCLNNGDGTFTPNAVYGAGDAPVSVALGDLDGDDDLDIAVVNIESDSASVLLNNGDGTFASQTQFVTGDSPQGVTIGDIDGDGDLDIATANGGKDGGAGANTVSLLINNGDGTFALNINFPAGDFPESVAMGDLDGNGSPDIALVNKSSDDVSVHLNMCATAGPCNAADLDVPYGIFDLADITVFVVGFYRQDLIADLAPPFGVLDLADVNLYVELFQAGCP
ncbi:MAG: VCBS repeat-containing protein, partial [Phycisphaerales bacterium]|nr:VCBS repeat-containing protein [Phycisphaerales bacterium]